MLYCYKLSTFVNLEWSIPTRYQATKYHDYHSLLSFWRICNMLWIFHVNLVYSWTGTCAKNRNIKDQSDIDIHFVPYTNYKLLLTKLVRFIIILNCIACKVYHILVRAILPTENSYVGPATCYWGWDAIDRLSQWTMSVIGHASRVNHVRASAIYQGPTYECAPWFVTYSI